MNTGTLQSQLLAPAPPQQAPGITALRARPLVAAPSSSPRNPFDSKGFQRQ